MSNTSSTNDPRVGVGVFVFDGATPSRFIMGRRKGSLGSGTWALPGGHLEFGESFEECAAREVLEETGLHLTDVRFLTATNTVFRDGGGKHYVTVFMTATADRGVHGPNPEAKLLEPGKCDGWEWKRMCDIAAASSAAMGSDMHRGSSEMTLFLPLESLLVQRPEVCRRLENLTRESDPVA